MIATETFLDTNIFLYALDRTDQRKSKIADDLIDQALLAGNSSISYQVVQEFIGVALRKFPAVMSHEELQRYLEKVFLRFRLVEPSAVMLNEALAFHQRYKLSWYDSLIVAAAIRAGCTALYTEDLQDGQRFGDVVVTNPFV